MLIALQMLAWTTVRSGCLLDCGFGGLICKCAMCILALTGALYCVSCGSCTAILSGEEEVRSKAEGSLESTPARFSADVFDALAVTALA